MSKEPVYSPPAFPVPELKGHHFKGLTKREYYASAAMEAILSSPKQDVLNYKQIANEAYLMADAMIERGAEMSRYDTLIEGFTALRVTHDYNINELSVRLPYYLNNTIQKDKQLLAILLRNDFTSAGNRTWKGRYSEDNVRQIRRIEQLLTTDTKQRIKHG